MHLLLVKCAGEYLEREREREREREMERRKARGKSRHEKRRQILSCSAT